MWNTYPPILIQASFYLVVGFIVSFLVLLAIEGVKSKTG